MYVRVDILLPFGKHMHDRITSLRREVSVHIAISTPPVVIAMPIPSQESEDLYICVKVVSILPLFMILTFNVVVIPIVW